MAGLDPAIGFALATEVAIATYTALDRVGTRLIDPLPYAAIVWMTTSVVLVLWLRVVRDRGGVLGGGPGEARRAAVGGWLTLGAYVLILVVLSVAPLSGGGTAAGERHGLCCRVGFRAPGRGGHGGETARRVGASALIVAGRCFWRSVRDQAAA